MLGAGVLEIYTNLINHEKAIVRKEVIWALSVVLARNPQKTQLCIDLGLVTNIIEKIAVEGD